MPVALVRLLKLASLAVTLLLSCRAADAPHNAIDTEALPREGERLTQPIVLPSCGMKIVEWRTTPSFEEETRMSPQAIATLDAACKTAIEKYPAFARSRGLTLDAPAPASLPSLSVLPGNVLLDGKEPRALNDVPGRFAAVAGGCCYWGLYVDRLDHLFVRNDPMVKNHGKLIVNARFVRTFEHELGHVLAARLGVLRALGNDRAKDEQLAEAFVGFLGFDFATESSSEDLAIRSGQLPGPAAHARSSP